MVDPFPALLVMVLICYDLRMRTFATPERKFEVKFSCLETNRNEFRRTSVEAATWLVRFSSHLI